MEWRRQVLSFFAFRLKDSVFLSLEKQCFVLTVLSGAIAIKAKKSSKTVWFCHVRLRQEDCKYHRYLWRDMDTKRPPDVYEMNCLAFGDKSSPCEANFAVRRTTEDNREEWPTAAAVVRRDNFVDDLYTSCGSETEAVTLREDVTALMAKGGFPMRKWISSSPDVLVTVLSEAIAIKAKKSSKTYLFICFACVTFSNFTFETFL